MRLTPLGRRVVAGAALIVVLAAGWALVRPVLADVLAARAGAFSGPTTAVVVHPGDTLLGIAHTAQPDADPRDVAVQIQHLNEMSDSRVSAGQRLVVPAGR